MNPSSKLKQIRKISVLFFAFVITLFTSYTFLPYGNHLQAAWAVDPKNSLDSFYYTEAASKVVLKVRGINCDAPVFTQDDLFHYKYHDYKKSAISQILGLYDIKEFHMNSIQKEFILKHLYETIEKCDPNIEFENLSPLMQVIFAKNPNPDFIKLLIQRGANVNQKLVHPTKSKSYTPLYLAETSLLKSTKSEETNKSLIKIIELLKQAGAKSEMTEF